MTGLRSRLRRWLDDNATSVSKFDSMLADMRIRQDADFAALSVAAQELRKLTEYA